MSVLVRNDPYTLGVPGRISCTSAMPARAFRVLDERAEHTVVVAQRAVDVDEAEDRRVLLNALAPTEHDGRHLDRVARVLGRDDAAHERLVRPADVRIHHVQVPRGERQVLRLDGRAAGAVDLVHRLCQLVEVVEVLDGRAAPPALEVGYERRTVDGRVDHVVAADGHSVLRVASLILERGRRLGRHLEHPAAFEAHPVVLDPHPGLPQKVERARVEEVDAYLLEDGHRLAVDHLDVIRGEDLVGLEAVLPHGCVK